MAIDRRSRWKWIGGAAAVVVVALALGIGLTAGRGGAAPDQSILIPGKNAPAPALSGTDPVSGRHVRLSAFRGRTTFVNVWGSWCEPCKKEAPDIARFTRDHPEVGFLGLDVSDTGRGARAFYRRYRWTHPSIADPNAAAAAAMEVQGTPTTFAIDKAGRIRGEVIGEVSYEQLVATAKKLS